MKTISSKPIRKTSWLNKLIKLYRFLKFDESDIIYGATTGLSLIRGMDKNSFDLSFSIRFNVPKQKIFYKKLLRETAMGFLHNPSGSMLILEQYRNKLF